MDNDIAKHEIKDEILSCRILIVEDDNLGRAVLKVVFQQQGFTHIEEAVNGRKGLDTARNTQQVLIPTDAIIEQLGKDYGMQLCGHYRPCCR